MTGESDLQTKDLVAFGPFRLIAAERRLERDGLALELGARAVDVLTMLIENAGEVVSKQALIERAWPNITVNEGCLRFHMAALRKALGDGHDGIRYLANVHGRGYCFVAPVVRHPATPEVQENLTPHPAQKLPPRLARMVGRDEVVQQIAGQLVVDRFVSIVGPGGGGKTTVAVSVGHVLKERFDGDVRFVDLGPLSDPLLVPGVIASKLGLLVQSNDPVPTLIAFLRDARILLILDSCEHVIDTASELAERIFTEAPAVHILATSRESLRVEGENVYRLPPLECPPEGVVLSADQAMTFPAVQLFVERVTARGHRYELTNADAPAVGTICRRLDGLPLAIELAAGRVDAYGVNQTAALLNDHLGLLWEGRRTAVPRHQTLNAMLDWSYELLPNHEQAILRRLSVFVGIFTLDAARAVAASDGITETQVETAVAGLIAKSLAASNTGEATARFRLLDTTRAFVLEKLIESGEVAAVARRHALYFRDHLQSVRTNAAGSSASAPVVSYGDHLGNVRAGLEWCFAAGGDYALGGELAAAAAPFLLELSFLTECHNWAAKALAALDDAARGTKMEMDLQAALGLSLMFTRGNSETVRLALTRALELAEVLEDLPSQLRLLGRLHIFHERLGEFHASLVFADRSEQVAKQLGDPVAISAAHSTSGISLHLMGDQAAARAHLDAAVLPFLVSENIKYMHYGFHYRNRAHIALARTLWLQGYADQAVVVARETVEEAEAIKHPITLCIALIWAVSVHLWTGDWDSTEERIERFIAHAEKYSLAPYQAVGLGVKGELAVRRGEPDVGIPLLLSCLKSVHSARYELLTTQFLNALAEGFAMAGRFAEALSTIDESISQIESNGDLFYMPEALRIRGEILSCAPDCGSSEAEDDFRRAIELGRRQSAPAWELRAANSLARLWIGQGRGEEARGLLAPIYARFTEGFGTLDARAADGILNVVCRHQIINDSNDSRCLRTDTCDM
jgi:predicted ATPase/DNA-binding winged helix-turn-helix (wHTH) protein